MSRRCSLVNGLTWLFEGLSSWVEEVYCTEICAIRGAVHGHTTVTGARLCRERRKDHVLYELLRTRRLRRAARGPEMSIKERLAALQLAGTGEFVPSASVNPTATRTRAESGETAPRDVTF